MPFTIGFDVRGFCKTSIHQKSGIKQQSLIASTPHVSFYKCIQQGKFISNLLHCMRTQKMPTEIACVH